MGYVFTAHPTDWVRGIIYLEKINSESRRVRENWDRIKGKVELVLLELITETHVWAIMDRSRIR